MRNMQVSLPAFTPLIALETRRQPADSTFSTYSERDTAPLRCAQISNPAIGTGGSWKKAFGGSYRALPLGTPRLRVNGRGFFAAHALDYVIHARQGFPTALCSLFPEVPLPCPAAVWEAPAAEAWAAEYRLWEESWDGQPLKARHVLCWVRGKETGHEDRLAAWFRSGSGLEDLVFVCARSQGKLAGAESLL